MSLQDILRIIHILAGAAWTGSTFFLVVVLGPTAAETQPESSKVMSKVGPRFRTFASVSGGFSLLSGLWLYWRTSGLSAGAFSSWIGVQTGTILTIGAIAGAIGFILGIVWAAPTTGKIMALGAEIAQGGGPPSPEQGARMGQLQKSQTNAGRVLAVVFVIAIVFMAWAGV